MISQKVDYEIKKGTIPGILFGDIKKSSNIFLHLNISNGNKEISKFQSNLIQKNLICNLLILENLNIINKNIYRNYINKHEY